MAEEIQGQETPTEEVLNNEAVVESTEAENKSYYEELGFNDESELVNDYKSLKERVDTFEPGYTPKDEYIKGVIDYYDRTGDLTPYVEAKSVNYDELGGEDIIRRKMMEEYGELDREVFEALYRKEVVDKYNLDPEIYSESEIKVGKALLDRDAKKVREEYKQRQEEFKIPEKEDHEAQYNAQLEEWEGKLRSFESTKKLEESSRIVIGQGESAFNFEVDPSSLIEQAKDSNKFFKNFVDEKGEYNMDLFYKVVAYATNPDAFESAFMSHGKAQGTDKVLNDIKNPSLPGGQTPAVSEDDSKMALLKAFADKANRR